MWNHFRDLENGTVKCGYCSKMLSVAAGSFGNLNRHLRTVHPAVILSTPKPTEMVHNEDVVDDPGIYKFNYLFEIIQILNVRIRTNKK